MHQQVNNFIFWLSRKINYPLCPPEVLQVSLTYRCNLRCKMCSIYNLAPKEDELSSSQIFHIVDEACRYGIEEILLTGGEPFLREDIFGILRYIGKKELRTVITTNGIMLNEKSFAVAVIEHIRGHIHFSLDGLEETNDFFRGEGTFKKVVGAIQNVDNLRKKVDDPKISIGIAMTVMNENVRDMFALTLLADRLGVDVVNFQPLVKNNADFTENKLPLYWVKNESLTLLDEEIKKIKAHNFNHVSVYEEPDLSLLSKYYRGELTKKDWVCFGGFKTVFICFDRKKPLVYSCNGICGNLNEISMQEAWTSHDAYKLRLHSRRCKNLCLQSCYSKESAQSFSSVLGGFIKNNG